MANFIKINKQRINIDYIITYGYSVGNFYITLSHGASRQISMEEADANLLMKRLDDFFDTKTMYDYDKRTDN